MADETLNGKVPRPLIWKGYDNALRGFSCKNMNGELLKPELALVKFKDGWRQFAVHGNIESVSTTAWTIDPHRAISIIDKDTPND